MLQYLVSLRRRAEGEIGASHGRDAERNLVSDFDAVDQEGCLPPAGLLDLHEVAVADHEVRRPFDRFTEPAQDGARNLGQPVELVECTRHAAQAEGVAVKPVAKAPADQFLLFEGEQNSQQGGAVKPGLLMQLVQAGGPKRLERAHHGDAAFDRANGLQPGHGSSSEILDNFRGNVEQVSLNENRRICHRFRYARFIVWPSGVRTVVSPGRKAASLDAGK